MTTSTYALAPEAAGVLPSRQTELVEDQYESAAQEQLRLARFSEGSYQYWLSTLPETITIWPQDLLIQLPPDPEQPASRVVVVPIDFRDEIPGTEIDGPRILKRNAGWWTCAVVASDHDKRPAGGRRMQIPAAEIVRGTLIDVQDIFLPF